MVVASVLALCVSAVIGVSNTIHNAYSAWWVADMVVEHMDANDNKWPKGWDDLLDDYRTCVANTGAQPWEFEELKKRVEIDWNANPHDLVSQQSNGKPKFVAIWLKGGFSSNWAGAEPNQIVLDYLNRQQ
jgi:hypothetical protein